MRMGMGMAAITLVLAGCRGDVTSPAGDIAFALESIDGQPLPVTLTTEYDFTVEVIDDVILLRGDSTFLEIAHFRGSFDDADGPSPMIFADSAAGSYTRSGADLLLLLPNAQISRM